MSAMEPLCILMGIIPSKLTTIESILLESELFLRLCEELQEIFRLQYQEYFNLLKLSTEKETIMFEANLARLMIQDILVTGEYTMAGIAHYTNSHEDVIQEVSTGLNLDPSANLLRKIIELHRLVRHDLYHAVLKKIAAKHLSHENSIID